MLCLEERGTVVKTFSFSPGAVVAYVVALVVAGVSAFVSAVPVYFLWNWAVAPNFADVSELTYLHSWGFVFLLGVLWHSVKFSVASEE